MCEDAGCDAQTRGIERVDPELMERFRALLAIQARNHGMTLDEFILNMNHVPYVSYKPPSEPLRERVRSWFESFWLNLRLLKPGL